MRQYAIWQPVPECGPSRGGRLGGGRRRGRRRGLPRNLDLLADALLSLLLLLFLLLPSLLLLRLFSSASLTFTGGSALLFSLLPSPSTDPFLDGISLSRYPSALVSLSQTQFM